MFVFKATYRDRNRIRKQLAKWYVSFLGPDGIERRLPGYKNKKASAGFGRKLEQLSAIVASREPLPRELAAWLESLPVATAEKLRKWGMLTGGQACAGKTLSEQLHDWQAFLTARGNTLQYVGMKISRTRKIFDGCRFSYFGDIEAARVMNYLAGLRDNGNGISAQTSNFYLQAAKQFCRWMCREGRASANVLEYLEGLNVRADRRHDRRALDVEEIRHLLAAAECGPTIQGLAGPSRALLYRLAVESGLRAAELASLTRESLRLNIDPPTVTVAAGYSKSRREDTLPLRPDTAADLRRLAAITPAGGRLFSLHKYPRYSVMIRADLQAAREQWIAAAGDEAERQRREETDFLTFEDSAGRYADFHALRHTAGSLLADAGVHPRVAQSLLRHSDINLTLSRYSHVYAGQEVDALAKLPDFGKTKGTERDAETEGKRKSAGT